MAGERAVLILARLAFVALAAAGVYTAVMPDNGGAPMLPWDKASHFLGFYGLAALGAFAFPKSGLWWLVLGLAALGAGIEVVQGLPAVGRDSDIKDFVADLAGVGAALGPLLIAAWRRAARAGAAESR